MSARKTETSSSTEQVTAAVRRCIRTLLTKNAAICPLVTGSSGQKRSLTGGLHPLVIPDAASRSMSASNTDVSSSTNGSSSRSDKSRALTKNAAICPLVTGSSGQKRSLAGGLHPLVTPVDASHSMSASKTDPSSSTNVIGGSAGGGFGGGGSAGGCVGDWVNTDSDQLDHAPTPKSFSARTLTL